MRKVPITLSMPENIVRDLHLYISPRKMSKFITHLVEKGLEEKKAILIKELQESSRDNERNKEFKIWDDQFLGEGLDETNDY